MCYLRLEQNSFELNDEFMCYEFILHILKLKLNEIKNLQEEKIN